LKRVREICDQHGILLVFDEVICGFGRTGKAFAAQSFGVTPDVMTLAKGLTNGAQPMGAAQSASAFTTRSSRGAGRRDRVLHGYTYSGHPAACAAGLATLDIYRNEGLFERGAALSPYFLDGLWSLKDLPAVADIRATACWRRSRCIRRRPGVRAICCRRSFSQRPPPQNDRRLGDRRAAVDHRKAACRYDRRLLAQDLAAVCITAPETRRLNNRRRSMKRLLAGMVFVAATVMAAAPAWAQKTVTFAYQDMMNPWRWVQQSQENRKGDRLQDQLAPVRRRRRCIRAMASGDVQLGEVGSTGIATADQPGHGRRPVLDSRGHRGRGGAGRTQRQRRQHDRGPQGKRSARRSFRLRTFSSSTRCSRRGSRRRTRRYSTCGRRKSPPRGARRHRRDIHLGSGAVQRQETGKVLMTSGDICKKGGVHVRWIDRDQEIRQGESGVHVGAGQGARQGRCRLSRQPEGVDRRSGQVAAGREVVGAKPGDVSDAMALYGFPSLQEQASPAWLAAAPTVRRPRRWRNQATFLDQRRLTRCRQRLGRRTVAPPPSHAGEACSCRLGKP